MHAMVRIRGWALSVQCHWDGCAYRRVIHAPLVERGGSCRIRIAHDCDMPLIPALNARLTIASTEDCDEPGVLIR